METPHELDDSLEGHPSVSTPIGYAHHLSQLGEADLLGEKRVAACLVRWEDDGTSADCIRVRRLRPAPAQQRSDRLARSARRVTHLEQA